MEQTLDKLLERMNEVEKSLKTDILRTDSEIEEIKNICLSNHQKYVELENTVKQQKMTINFLQKEVNKNNLIIFGLVEEDGNIMRELLTAINEKLNVPVHEEDICKIYRMRGKGTDNTGPVKVGFYDYKLKINIYHARSVLKGTQIFINEDLPKDIRIPNGEKRKAREQNNKKRLAQQLSEENDSTEPKISQDFKKLKDRKTVMRSFHLRKDAVISNNQKK